MVRGSLRTRTIKRYKVRTPSGTVTRYRRKKSGKPTSPTGKFLPGTASGTKTEIQKLTKTQRRPSRPYGGVLSSPELRAVMLARVQKAFTPGKQGKLFQPGTECIKIAGRDAGKRCTVTEVIDKHYVKVTGDTRPRKINVKHLEPLKP